ncbi:nuclear transport factor 2 family protein [Yinghuangia soli]|uniref:Nuclear transport factor 2 family protein n=1 Tax=Yinghuangia soli TaxID=2908204 RepID=A0AA41Q8H6_9ACTN|nr:nuclear transport factor 2 family protein [Yinghuangia soli]MCF2533554.1 nuclear transport factor 2 family protein [Yinghuangia soli]
MTADHDRDLLRQLLDRRELDDLLVRYATALDTRDFDLLDQVFTADAAIDYSSAGGPKGPYPDLKRYFTTECFVPFDSWQHHITNKAVTLDGADTAHGRTSVYNPLAFTAGDGTRKVLHAGAWYEDRFVRTADGWRIAARTLGMSWLDGAFPDVPPPARRPG